MRSLLLALSCLAVGALGALGYSHYLGEGKQLADLQDQLDAAKASLAKVTQESQQAKSETDSMSAQIQQLISTKQDLQKQVDDLKTASTAPAPAAVPVQSAGMANIMEAGLAQHIEQELLLLKTRLHLTPDQELAVKFALEAEAERAKEMTAKMFSGGKIDPQTMADIKNAKTVDQTLNDILTPDQKTAYQQIQTDQKNSAVEMAATVEVNQMSPLLQLSDSQKDQAYSALAQVQADMQDPNWIKANMSTRPTDPTAILDAQAKAKEDALAKILTPDQLATYHQQAQGQLDMQKAMMQKLTPQAGVSASVVVPASGTVSP